MGTNAKVAAGRKSTDLRIEYIPVRLLRPYPKNARTHPRKQLCQLAGSIAAFGFTNPVLIDDALRTLCGHARVEAAKLQGMDEVPCVKLSSMTEAQKRAYVIADNKLALNAGWDEDLLAEELGALLDDEDLDFDIGVTGFSIAEIDSLVECVEPQEPGDPRDDALPELDPDSVCCRLGDVWQLGRHRLVCGDALDQGVVSLLMDGEKATMVFSDPPYNVKVDGHVGGLGKTKHREFAFASGELSSQEFTAFLQKAFANMAAHSTDGAIHFQCMDWRHMGEMMQAGRAVYTELKNLIVWSKDNGGMGTFYRSRHELVFAWKHGTAPHINTFELGQHGRAEG